MRKTKKSRIKLLIRASLALTFLLTACLHAEQIKFALQPGSAYEYILTSAQSNDSLALSMTFNSSAKPESVRFILNVIDFQENAFIVDISCAGQIFRRYIKEDGSISGAPGEAGQQIPFFLSFPSNDWQPGQRHQLKRTINIGRQSFSTNWQMLLKSIDKEKDTAEILFTCAPELPSNKLARRKFTLKGRMIFDLTRGVVNQAEWATEYYFQLHNKEIAITRNIWGLKEKVTYSLKLVSIAEQ